MEPALELHDGVLSAAIDQYGGYVFSRAGDAFAAAFARADDAVAVARSAQEALAATLWPESAPIRVRMGLHTGEAQERDGDYFGPALNRAARIMAAGHGGQVLVSSTTAGVLGGDGLVDLGEHRLKDLGEPEQIFQLPSEAEFPPLKTLRAVRNNLPVQRTAFVGREADIGRVTELLGQDRLVTLTGIGGVGKTRLALAAAAVIADRFPDGLFFVDLSPVGSGDQVPEAVAEAIGLQGQDSVATRVADFLAGRDVLVVLDNCEHLIDEVADFVDQVLERGGSGRLLATSREDLEVEGERTFRVPSLTVDSESGPGSALELLMDRAAISGMSLSDDRDTREVLNEICRRLDGIPLAIELAAVQLAHLAPAELLGRLDQRFDLLSGGRRRRRQRQQTLQAVMDWSWELLEPHEQGLLARLAVFSGSWNMAMAEGICADAGDPPVATTLISLVHKSLVQRSTDNETSSRYRMLETVRLYAQQRLVDQGRAEELRGRHLAWYVDAIDRDGLDVHMFSMNHVARFVADLDNVRAAIDWAISTDDRQAAANLVMCGASLLFASTTGSAGLLDTVDHLLNADLPSQLRARLEAARLWYLWAVEPNPETIAAGAERVIAMSEQAGDPFSEAQGCVFKAMFSRGGREIWEALVEQGQAAVDVAGSELLNEVFEAFMLNAINYPWLAPEDVIRNVEASAPEPSFASVGRMSDLNSMLGAALVIGDIDRAQWAAGQLDWINSELNLPHSWTGRLDHAFIAGRALDLPSARAHLRQVIETERASDVGPARPDWLLVPAIVAERQEDYTKCAVLLEAARTSPVGMSGGHAIALYRHLRRELRSKLDTDQLASAQERGRQLDPEAAIENFLGDNPRPSIPHVAASTSQAHE